jgi:hypothetical protein
MSQPASPTALIFWVTQASKQRLTPHGRHGAQQSRSVWEGVWVAATFLQSDLAVAIKIQTAVPFEQAATLWGLEPTEIKPMYKGVIVHVCSLQRHLQWWNLAGTGNTDRSVAD